MFSRILERHGPEIVGALIFERPKRDRALSSVQRALALDGIRGVPRLAAHAARHAWRGLRCSPPHFFRIESLFKRHAVPVWHFARPNESACIDRLRRLGPDVVHNVQPWRLQRDVLAVPRLACVNQHAGDLSRYRGLEPVVRALLNGDSEFHVTIHTMTEAYDAGDVLARAVLPMKQSVFECYRDAFDAVPDLLDRALGLLSQGDTGPRIDPASTPYYGAFSADEIRRFRQARLRYL